MVEHNGNIVLRRESHHQGCHFFFFAKRGFFPAIRHRIGPIIRHVRALWSFCLSTDYRFKSHLVNSRKRWSLLFRPIGLTSASSEYIRRVKSTVSPVTWPLVYQWTHVLSTVMKWRRKFFGMRLNSIKRYSEVVSRLRLLSRVSKCGTYRADRFFMHKKFHAGYDPHGLLQYLLSQLVCTPSIGGLSVRDPVFLSRYPSW